MMFAPHFSNPDNTAEGWARPKMIPAAFDQLIRGPDHRP